MITGNMIVKNEDQFVGYAIQSVLPQLDELLIYDTGSIDKTVEIIESIKSEKIHFEEKGEVTPGQLVDLRREQIGKTKTEFFMLVDGDEVWPKENIEKFVGEVEAAHKDKIAFFCRTRNCVGDIYHYLPEDAGQYRLAGKKGHLNIRAYRKVPGLSVEGVYPLEAYTLEGISLNNQDRKLLFVDTWYLHTTHLQRSSLGKGSKYKYELGMTMKTGEIPEVLTREKFPRRSAGYLLRALLETPLKRMRRWLG